MASTVFVDYVTPITAAWLNDVNNAVYNTGTGVSTFNGRAGTVNLSASDVTVALGYAPVSNTSPTFYGTPVAPTASPGTNTTQIATTAFVASAVAASTAGVSQFNGRTGVVSLTSSDVTTALGYTPASSATGVSTFNSRTGAVTLTQGDVVTALSVDGTNLFSVGGSTSSTFAVSRGANYTGGTPGYVNGAIYATTLVGANATAFEWTIIGVNNNHATAGENVGVYGQGNKFSTGPTWGMVAESCDLTNAASSSGSGAQIGIEVDVWCNGADNTNTRVGMDIVVGNAQSIRNGVPGIGAGEGYTGWRVQSYLGSSSNGTFKYGGIVNTATAAGIWIASSGTRGISLTGTYVNGIDLSASTNTGNAIQLKGGDAIGWEATAAIKTKWNQSAGYLEFWNGSTRYGYIDLFGGGDVKMNASGGTYMDLTTNQSISGTKTFSGLKTTLGSTTIGTASGTFTSMSGWGGANAKNYTDTNTINWDAICQVNFISSFIGGSYSASNLEGIIRPLYCVVSEIQALLMARGIY